MTTRIEWLVVLLAANGCAYETSEQEDDPVALAAAPLLGPEREDGALRTGTVNTRGHAAQRAPHDPATVMRPNRKAKRDFDGHLTLSLPVDTSIGVGQTFQVGLAGEGFDALTEGGAVDLGFDPDVASLETIAFDTSTWEFHAQHGVIDNTSGEARALAFASFAGHRGEFPIATLTFRARVADVKALRPALKESLVNPFAGGGRRLRVKL